MTYPLKKSNGKLIIEIGEESYEVSAEEVVEKMREKEVEEIYPTRYRLEETIAQQYRRENNIFRKEGYQKALKEGANSDEEMCEFGEWLSINMWTRTRDMLYITMKSEGKKTMFELLQIFKHEKALSRPEGLVVEIEMEKVIDTHLIGYDEKQNESFSKLQPKLKDGKVIITKTL